MSSPVLDALRRHPDVEAPNLYAVDASDRLVLDEAASALTGARDGEVVVIGDHYGALTIGAVSLHGATGVRVHTDRRTGELALAANAGSVGVSGYSVHDLDAALLTGARVVLLQLPRSLAALDEVAGVVARHAAPDVVLVAGGRVKHMTPAMNDVLGRHFGDVRATLGRQKSRALVARQPVAGQAGEYPRSERDPDLGLTVCAHGEAFAGTKVDIGTRFLLTFLSKMAPEATRAVDLGCGTGVLACALKRARPALDVLASDESTAAVLSARATVAANNLEVTVARDFGLTSRADASADLILLNPPFHTGATVHERLARPLFVEAGRVLRPGGELWTVFNSSLEHRDLLREVVGPTRQAGRNRTFTVAVSTKD